MPVAAENCCVNVCNYVIVHCIAERDYIFSQLWKSCECVCVLYGCICILLHLNGNSLLFFEMSNSPLCPPLSAVVLVCALLPLLSLSHACPKECSCNSNTKVVDCRGQGLYDIPRRLHPDTQELYLQDNRIRGLGSMAFREIPLVRILDLSNNSITSVSPTALLGLRTLQRLSLAYNSLRELDKRLLGPIRSLSHLDLSHNRLNNKTGAQFLMCPLSNNTHCKLDAKYLIVSYLISLPCPFLSACGVYLAPWGTVWGTSAT